MKKNEIIDLRGNKRNRTIFYLVMRCRPRKTSITRVSLKLLGLCVKVGANTCKDQELERDHVGADVTGKREKVEHMVQYDVKGRNAVVGDGKRWPEGLTKPKLRMPEKHTMETYYCFAGQFKM